MANSFEELVKKYCEDYTNFTFKDHSIRLPFQEGRKNTPDQAYAALMEKFGPKATPTQTEIQTWVDANPQYTAVDCSGLIYYVLNEATNGKVKSWLREKLNNINLSYREGVSKTQLTDSAYSYRITRPKEVTPGCLLSFYGTTQVILVHDVKKDAAGKVIEIDYTLSIAGKGPVTGYITVGNEEAAMNNSAQVWHDQTYSPNDCRMYYSAATRLLCLMDKEWIQVRNGFGSFKQGDIGEDVLKIRRLLREKGYACNTSSSYDMELKEVIRTFQKDNNLLVDGIAGQGVLAVLEDTSDGTDWLVNGKVKLTAGQLWPVWALQNYICSPRM